MHDRIAELAGLSAELFNYTQYGNDRADQVREQINRVRGELEAQAAALEARAEELTARGQDALAGEATEEAQGIRAVLEEAPKNRVPRGTGGKRTAAAEKAPEKA